MPSRLISAERCEMYESLPEGRITTVNEISKAVQDAVILIPSLEPDERLPAYIRALEQSGFGRIVVVDDGSGEDYLSVFREVGEIPRTTVLHHKVNRGKASR